MIFSTQSQLNAFLIFIFCGAIVGLCSAFLSIIFLRNYQKKIVKIVFSAIFYSFFGIFFVFLLNFFNFGKFSVVLVCAYIVGFRWIKNITKKLVVILQNSWYNKIIRTLKAMSTKLKSKEKKTKNEISNES